MDIEDLGQPTKLESCGTYVIELDFQPTLDQLSALKTQLAMLYEKDKIKFVLLSPGMTLAREAA